MEKAHECPAWRIFYHGRLSPCAQVPSAGAAGPRGAAVPPSHPQAGEGPPGISIGFYYFNCTSW